VDRSMRKSTANCVSPRLVQTSTVKKSATARMSHCVFKNSAHVVFFSRSGAGSRPFSRGGDGGDRASGDLVLEVSQSALDPPVAPAAVLGGESARSTLGSHS